MEKDKDQGLLLTIIILTAILSVMLRLIYQAKLEQTSLLFIGIPTLLALLVAKTPPSTNTSTIGITFRVITLFLLIAGILLGEGIACILVAAPLFYGIAAILIGISKLFNDKTKDPNTLDVSLIIPMALLLAQIPSHQSPPIEQISSHIIIDGQHSLAALGRTPILDDDLPLFFKLGFPVPVSIDGNGLAVGDIRKTTFRSTTKGLGDLVLKVIQSTPSKVIFQVISDHSHIAHWLTWKTITVSCLPQNDHQTRISWTSTYTCDLNPRWYFAPLERYAVGLANTHLLDAYFGPVNK